MDDDETRWTSSETGLTAYQAMTDQEAAQLAIFLLGQFPNASGRSDPIFGKALASLFKTFPRSVVHDCVNAQTGFATTTNFVSLHGVHEWCNERAERFAHKAAQQRRIAEQIRDRERKPRTERGMAMTKAWLERTDPASRGEAGDRPPSTNNRYNYGQFLGWARCNGKAPRPLGRFEDKPTFREFFAHEIEAAKKKLIAEFGQAAFDAIPDQPLGWRKLDLG